MVFVILPILMILPVPSWGGLLAGLILAQWTPPVQVARIKKWIPKMLAWSIVGLGAGMNFQEVLLVGAQGVLYTVLGISFTIFFGIWLGEKLRTEREARWLISVGTAICGGSAIAAVAPVIRAKSESMTVALVTVFMLNAIALAVFPPIGHALGLTEPQFGLWAALAIHDTSSVVGAGMEYGPQALKIATTIKLARAFWIAPVAFLIGLYFSRQTGDIDAPPVKRPWFILGFILMAALFTYVSVLQPYGAPIADVAKRVLVGTLFLIGASLNREGIKKVGYRPFAFGVILWVVVSVSTLALIKEGVIR